MSALGDSFSARLRALRGPRKKAEMARVVGVSAQVYQRYEAGRVPRAEMLVRMSVRGGVSVGWLLGLEPEQHPENEPAGIMRSSLASLRVHLRRCQTFATEIEAWLPPALGAAKTTTAFQPGEPPA